LSSQGPGENDWTSPSQPGEQPPYFTQPTPAQSPPPPPPYSAYPSSPAETPAPYGWGPSWAPQAPKPGVIPLRPLAVGELLDGAFTTIRRYPRATLGLAAAVMVVVEAIQVVIQWWLLHGVTDTTTLNADGTFNTNAGDFFARSLVSDLAIFVVTLVSTALLSGMLAAVVGQGVLGRPMSASQAWAATRAAFGRLFGATLLIFLIEIGVFVVGVLPGVLVILAGSTAGGVFLAVIGGLAALVAFVYIQTVLLFTPPAVMLERQGIRAAMARSRALVAGSWWRVFGIFLLATIMAEIIAGIIVIPFALFGGIGSSILSGHPSDQFQFSHLVITGIGGFLAATLVRPFTSGVVALLYLDRRMRAEALDLTLQNAAARTTS
jgi:hypothetical protein